MRIDTGTHPRFADRQEAGRQLAARLGGERVAGAVVVGLARGGVEVAAEVAAEMRCPLDALVVRKVGHPAQPEFAIGAVTADGGAYVSGDGGLPPQRLLAAVDDAQRRALQLDRRLHGRVAEADIAGRPCILVDDGVATGATMRAAIDWARRRDAARVLVAVPVAPRETAERIRAQVERLVCLFVPVQFGAVGVWYDDFTEVPDLRVAELLEAASARAALR
ncbi:MAG TPA: phosphoribosyltransferase family protein [Gaiellales bacterium]|nr:phosphoribosyltransferase family protein [Gaiellales bacterium]